MEPHRTNPPNPGLEFEAGRNGGDGRGAVSAPSGVADHPQGDKAAPEGSLAGETTGESRRQRWIAGLVIAVSMLIAMLLLLYGGYWLYHQKNPPFSSLRPVPSAHYRTPNTFPHSSWLSARGHEKFSVLCG
jgi:hypothetical protein